MSCFSPSRDPRQAKKHFEELSLHVLHDYRTKVAQTQHIGGIEIFPEYGPSETVSVNDETARNHDVVSLELL